ncbi:MAG: hypothetical protein V9G98_01615 [Candidatus Competibacter sp.]
MIKQTSPNVPAVLAVYLIAFLQGLTLVSFPASSAVLRQMHGFTDAQYGAIFLPQVALAVLGAVAGGTLARRLGLQPLLWLTAAGNGLSQLALAASLWVMPALAFPAILAGTALLGWSFGLGGAPLNSYPPRFFPRRAPAAVVALHTLLGLGLMVGPLLADGFGRAGWWIGFPLSLLGLSALLALAAATVRLPSEVGGETDAPRRCESAADFRGVLDVRRHRGALRLRRGDLQQLGGDLSARGQGVVGGAWRRWPCRCSGARWWSVACWSRCWWSASRR